MESDKDRRLRKFLDHYGASIVNSARRTITRPVSKFFTDPNNAGIVRDARDFYYRDYADQAYFNEHYTYERAWIVEIPESALDDLANMNEKVFQGYSGSYNRVAQTILQKEFAEADIRAKNPAVQAAWEQYSLMLHLASNGKDLP